MRNARGSSQGNQGGDSLQRRNRFEDSITIRFYYMDSIRPHKFDSSIADFTTRFPIKPTEIFLGNTGSPTRSLLFSPSLKAGWDAGFHAYDTYKWTLDQIRFYNTTRPYTELGYMIASKAEQIIQITHTQNIKPYWNFSLNYRLISAPGIFRNERTNHNNYLVTSWYQSPNKRYNNYFVLLYNRMQAEENGGITDLSQLHTTTSLSDPFTVPTKIGGDPRNTTNFFSSAIYTGHRYRELNVLMRQQYDLGRKDSLVTDSTVIPLFYPRIRFEHTLNIGKYSYSFFDLVSQDQNHLNVPDTNYYQTFYNSASNNILVGEFPNDSVKLQDTWREISNDFSIYTFPDSKNLQQFVKLGTQLQLLKGQFSNFSASLYNIIGHGEYRNRTKNQKWDMVASGQLYFTGYNAGDYHAYVSLTRLLGAKLGSLQVGFENVNRSPSFLYDQRSSFYLDNSSKSFGKENTVHFFGTAFEPKFGLQLGADYYLVNHYLYLNGFYQLQQEGSLFNILRVNASKRIPLSKHWSWNAELYVQQKTGPAPVNIPAVLTRNRLMYEGDLGFKNLTIAFGTEIRYYTPYSPANYSPVLGQFFYQDTMTVSNRPDIGLFVHFRIKGFKAYFRIENLNTANLSNGLEFNKNNIVAPYYPMPGLLMRFGVFWSFVN